MYDKEEKHDFGQMDGSEDSDKSSKPVLQTGEVSEAIHKAAAEMEAQSRFSRLVGINMEGEVKLFQSGEVSDEA